MNWMFLAIAARFLWACENLIDDYTARYFGQDKIAPVILQNSFALLSLPVLLLLNHGFHLQHLSSLEWIAVSVVVNTLALGPFMRALQIDDVRHVVPLFEMVPVFVMLLAWIVLRETMAPYQFIGALLIIAAGFAFMFDFNHRRLKGRVLGLMMLAAILYATSQLCMRHVSQSETSLDGLICFCGGIAITGFMLAFFRREKARHVVKALHGGGSRLFILAVLNEGLSRLAWLTLFTAYAWAPTAGHVAAFSGTQPVFLSALFFLMTHLKPAHYKKIVWDKDTIIKLALLPVMAVGAAILNGKF